MTVFDTMVDTLYSDPNFGVSATYTPKAGAAVAVTIVRDPQKIEQIYSPFENKALTTAYLFDVRASEIAQPLKGDVIEVDGDRFVVMSAEADSEKLVWRLNVDKKG